MSRSIVLSLLIALATFPVAARADTNDSNIGQAAVEAVTGYEFFTIFDDVNVAVLNRAVTLTGHVTSPQKREDIGKRVAKVDGIRSLANDIRVLPAILGDAQLRVRIADAIYGHPMFRHYTSMVVPPIHIIVENSHVTLTGRVNSPTERTLAYVLAQVPGVFDVKNALQLDSE
jgi:osmotically-inducible protein OsmY